MALPALKAMAAVSAIDGVEHAVQMFGAMGFTDERDVRLFLRYALVLAARRGDVAEQRREALIRDIVLKRTGKSPLVALVKPV